MDPKQDTTNSSQPESDPAIAIIVRGEEVLAEARAIAQKISDRISKAVTERPPPKRTGISPRPLG